jgi:radical SAM superfamily enzyme YgiQ (UPF0313 family)
MKLDRILLVQPAGPQSDGFTSLLSSRPGEKQDLMSAVGYKAAFAPVSVATVAALTPKEIEVDLWDEIARGAIDPSILAGYDLVGVTGFYLHRPRVQKIAEECQARRVPCVVGGPGVSSEPESYRERFDHIFIGEAEFTWPRFIEEFRAGRPQREYRQIEKPELGSVPLPRWGLVPNLSTDYAMAPVQTTRGCPFDCEFCDVIHLFGRRSRHKPVATVVEELRQLERRGVRRIFFSDDNFIGHPPYAKELLRELIPLNNSFRRPLSFFTQLSLNVAKDDELLELLADANFRKVLIGIESANPESLREAHKPQNYKTDMMADIHKIHSYGIAIHGQMIVGFDHDGPEVFEQTYQFIQQSCIPVMVLNVLHALPGTQLWHRLRRERRLLAFDTGDGFAHRSNIVFKEMSRAEVLRGFVELYNRIYSPDAVRERMEGMVRQVKRRARVPGRQLRAAREERRAARGALRLMFFHPDKEMRRAFRRSMWTTLRHAPFMLERMFTLGVNVADQGFVQTLRPKYESLILKEQQHPPRLASDKAVSVPEAFRKEYKSIFPSVYLRMASRLHDKSGLHPALVKVFSEFIERFHDEYDRLGDDRFIQLQEICDRTIAKLNNEDPTGGSWPDATAVQAVDRLKGEEERRVVRDVRRARLDDDILSAVEQDLHREEEARNGGRLQLIQVSPVAGVSR